MCCRAWGTVHKLQHAPRRLACQRNTYHEGFSFKSKGDSKATNSGARKVKTCRVAHHLRQSTSQICSLRTSQSRADRQPLHVDHRSCHAWHPDSQDTLAEHLTMASYSEQLAYMVLKTATRDPAAHLTTASFSKQLAYMVLKTAIRDPAKHLTMASFRGR